MMFLSEIVPEAHGLPDYDESRGSATWRVGSLKFSANFETDGQLSLSIQPAGVRTWVTVSSGVPHEIGNLIRQMSVGCPPLICPSDGALAYAGLVLVPDIGYTKVYWFGDCPTDMMFDDDAARESAVSAVGTALGIKAVDAGICVEAWCLGFAADC